jgi:hypothetical protein
MSASYFLSPHVHVCVAGNQVVLLDLERDKYLSLALLDPVGRCVHGWPIPTDDEATAAVSAPDSGNAVLSKMISQGLLVSDPTLGKQAAPVATDPAKVAMVEYDLNVRPSTTLGHLWRVLTAYTAAKWSLEHRPIKEVVRAAGLRKQQARPASLDADSIRPLVTAFVHLRPLFFTAKEACLLDSLTLVNFLASYRVFPQWIFGVKTDPFYAHCWVQQGDHVFNDTPDYVRGFSPILVV